MKINYNNILFDSDLEVQYYQYLKEKGVGFIYHPSSIQLTKGNKYTPDFLVEYEDRYEIVETKGYNQFSFMRDNMIHNLMKQLSPDQLVEYSKENGFVKDKPTVYKKIKYLKTYGWVEFEFKNPNTLANQRKNKIESLEEELKSTKAILNGYARVVDYLNKDKLTKVQKEWAKRFLEKENLLGTKIDKLLGKM